MCLKTRSLRGIHNEFHRPGNICNKNVDGHVIRVVYRAVCVVGCTESLHNTCK